MWSRTYGQRFVDLDKVKRDLQTLHQEGYRSLAIVFVHSYTFPEHELLVGNIAREIGFTHVSESSQLLPMIKMVPRGVSSTADAYLTPILREYLDGFFSGFDEKLRDGRLLSPRVEFMGSDGGLLDTKNFSGLKSILSGPAGGVVGYALTSWDKKRNQPVIGYAPSPFLPFRDSNSVLGLMSAEPPQMSPDLTGDTK
jgi:5-oxoprolinase (ATP-hydrolysing)